MSIGFKEWSLVCEALGRGRQCILLRKGGIAEEGGQFRFKYSEFFLYPTFFHQQKEKTKILPDFNEPVPSVQNAGIRYFAKVRWVKRLVDLKMIKRLSPFHIWQESVIEERYRYRQTAYIDLAFVEILQLSEIWRIQETPEIVGCKSWVPLPALPAEIGIYPIYKEENLKEFERQIVDIVGS